MRFMIRTMKRRVLCSIAYLSVVFLMFSCNWGKDSPNNPEGVRPGKEGRYYGGVFHLNETEYIKTLFPHNIIDVYSYRVASQIYEGLFKFDQKTLKVVKGLAEDYQIDESRTVYTIKLRKGVLFHDDECFPNGKGRELKAQDIKYCITRLATQSRDNQGFHVLDGVVKGARQYFLATKDGETPNFEIEGIKLIDDYTVQFTLEKPNSLFLYYLARPEMLIFPKEAYDKYGVDMRIKAVGTGPFKLASVDEDLSIILKKNENYYGTDEFGNRLPFLEAIQVQFIKDKKTELFEFRKNNLHMIYRLPTDYIIEIIDEVKNGSGNQQYELQREPEMNTQMLVFMNKSDIFKDLNVRKAFSYAVDREKILDYVLNGEGFAPGHHGITPPSFKEQGYDINDVTGYQYQPDSAKIFLSKAGYPNGKGFPKIYLDLNAEGDRHTSVAVEVQKQLKEVLNIEIELVISPHNQITEKAMSGNFELLRLSWLADFPNPEAFLRMFYSKDMPDEIGKPSYPNVVRYKNPKYDELYEKAMNASSTDEAYKYFKQAENLVMQDAPVIVLWYDEGYRLLRPNVKNFPNNPMQYRDFSEVYLDPNVGNGTTEGASTANKGK